MRYIIRPIQIGDFKEPTVKEIEDKLAQQFLERKMSNNSSK